VNGPSKNGWGVVVGGEGVSVGSSAVSVTPGIPVAEASVCVGATAEVVAGATGEPCEPMVFTRVKPKTKPATATMTAIEMRMNMSQRLSLIPDTITLQ
jgi:hypothetical protein